MSNDVLSMLEADHRAVERMLADLSATEPGDERDALVAELVAALSLHMDFEEEHVYPLLQEIDEELVQEADVEHDLARDGVAKLTALSAKPGFAAVVDMVTAGISHHVKDEEKEAFPTLRQHCDDDRLASLARTLVEAKQTAGIDVTSGASKEELLEMAREHDIKGRSAMTKDELRQALHV